MARPKSSAKFICTECGETKLPTLFPTLDAKVCSACSAKSLDTAPCPPPLPGDLPPAKGAVSVPVDAAGELFSHVDAEIDPAQPTSQELARRTLARRRLLHFIKRFRPKYSAGWVHEDVCRRLERFIEQVEQKKSPRLLLMMPYRHGKSEITSRHAPPFILGHHPEWEIIAASNAQSLATSFSRYIRDMMRDPSYHALFPTAKLDPQSQAVENWSTTMGGGYLAAGAGSAIIGRGADVLILDDLFRNAEEADSQVIRDNIWEWYLSTAYSRLAPGGGVLGITTCWNEDDWAGRVQLAMAAGGDNFEVVKYPAINDQGDEYILPDDSIVQIPPEQEVPEGARLTRPMNTALHGERYTLEMLLRIKSAYYALGNQRWWAAGYQQDPTPEEGAYFTKEMFRYYVNAPHKLERNVYQAWDFAITEKQQGDYIVGSCAEQDHRDNLFFTDIMRFKSGDAYQIVDSILDFWVIHGSEALLGFEDGQIWKSIEAVFKRRCEERSLYPSYETLKPFTDKFVRAQPLRGRMQQGKVWFPQQAPWFDALRNEFLRFGAGGKHDDQVDASAWVTRLALSHSAPRLSTAQQPLKSWKDRLAATLKGRGATHMAA